MIMGQVTDIAIMYRILKPLVSPWDTLPAYKLGIIDEKGSPLKNSKDLHTSQEKNAYTPLDRLIFTVKRALDKVPNGIKSIGGLAIAAHLLKECYNTDTYIEETIEVVFESLLSENVESEIQYVSSILESTEYIEYMLSEEGEGAPANSTGTAVSGTGDDKSVAVPLKLVRRKQVENLKEMAQPTDDAKNKMHYHGTSSRDAALSIANSKLEAPDLKDRGGFLKPVQGKVYVTPHIHYAQIYALGGDVAGSSYKPKHEYGYLFGVHGSKLRDVQPDEDSIGGMLSKYKTEDEAPRWLHPLAQRHLGPNTYSKAKDGEYAWQAKAGKTLVNKMSDSQKNELIDKYGAHVAHTGSLEHDSIYRIHTSKIPLLKSDGSNFFDHAEKITKDQI